MLPSELLMYRYNAEHIIPKTLTHTPKNLNLAEELIQMFRDAIGLPRHQLNEVLSILEGAETDYRVKRGLAHILATDYSTFDIQSPLEPAMLREKVFRYSALLPFSPSQSQRTLAKIAEDLTRALERPITPEQITQGLYADLPENHVLNSFEAPTAEDVLHRYNTAQAQGILYRAYELKITAYRNDPSHYKQLFKYLKLFGLMSYIEGDTETGFTITLDGPTSLFKSSTRYGLSMAKFLPALLNVTHWKLNATLRPRKDYNEALELAYFELDSGCGLKSHYSAGKVYDSALEENFVAKWGKTKTEWTLEREVDLIPIPGSVMIPDFRLVHPSGKSYLLEIVGYWRPSYLQKKFAQVRKAGRDDLILAVSDRLNLEEAGVNLSQLPAKVVMFKGALQPKSVLDLIEHVA